MTKLLNLQEWADEAYTTPPSLSTLRRWAREGRIYPAPELHGKEYKVTPGAFYVDPKKKTCIRRTRVTGKLVEKLQHDEKTRTL